MHYDFDREIDRRHTDSEKYDGAAERGLPEDVLPLWVADMDFQAPEPVLRALLQRVDHGIFGYTGTSHAYYEAAARWFALRHGWKPEESWLVQTPGVVTAVALAVRALTEPGDGVLIQRPVYYPFAAVIEANDRRVVDNPLRYENGKYTIDFEDMEEKLRTQGVKAFVLCSPHNPVGRVWTRQELARMGELCGRCGVYVISDEIHCDFAFPEHPHTMFPLACPELADRTVVCTAPSKTFNLAGLQCSNIWIPGEDTRKRFRKEQRRVSLDSPNVMGLTACRAAYEEGAEWLDQCRDYLRENLNFLRRFLAERLPEIRLVEPEGTYFAWLDCSGLGMNRQELEDLIVHKARLWLDSGAIFGEESWAFQRVVLACTRKTLERALVQLEQAVRGENP